MRYSPLETAVDLIFQALVQPNLLKIRFKFPLSGHLRAPSFILLLFFFISLLRYLPRLLIPSLWRKHLTISNLSCLDHFFGSKGQHTYIWLLNCSILRVYLESINAKQTISSLDHVGFYFSSEQRWFLQILGHSSV